MASGDLGELYQELVVLSPFNEVSGATIYSAKDVQHANRKVAIKQIDKGHLQKLSATKVEERLANEVAALRATTHVAGVCHLHAYLERGSQAYLVMELCAGRQLFEEVASRASGHLSEEEGAAVFAALVEAVQGIHDAGFIHRDLKPENVLCERADCWRIKVVDFGAAKKLENIIVAPDDDDQTHDDDDDDSERSEGLRSALYASVSGTLAWNVTPERGFGEAESTAADVWALGCILYYMLVGNAPFKDLRRSVDEQEDVIVDRVIDEDLAFPPGCHLSPPAVQLISWLLEKDAFDRPTIQQIKDHPFFKNRTKQQ